MKIFCSTDIAMLNKQASGVCRVLLFSRSNDKKTCSIGTRVREFVERKKHVPDPMAWDFASVALSVFAADQAVSRAESADGWTRQIELAVSVRDPDFWVSQKAPIEEALQFLTTDLWSISFTKSTASLKTPKKVSRFRENSISLLSGGLDSLIAAVDLAKRKEKVLLASQVAGGDSARQVKFAKSLGLNHAQLTHGAEMLGHHEPSTRSRSIVFVAYGVLAATLLAAYEDNTITVRMPENGFMSINPPLTDARLGSLSTRTTHPVFVHRLQALLSAADLRIKLENPYQFKTKGEMLRDCRNQEYIQLHAHDSTSCGRFVRTGYQHCGRCVPCLVRRAAFHFAKLPDKTKYKYKTLKKNDRNHSRFDDVRSLAIAGAIAKREGIESLLGTSLMSQLIVDAAPYKKVVGRGLKELQAFLDDAGVK